LAIGKVYGIGAHHRKDVRVEDVVIIISIEDEPFETLDWSFGGFRVGGYRGSITNNAEFLVNGIGPDLDTMFAVRVDCKAIRVTDDRLSASFVEISSDVYDVLEALMTRRQKALDRLKARLKCISLADRFRELAGEHIERIFAAFWKLKEAQGTREAELAAVYREVDKLKRQSEKLDYDLLTAVGDELCRFIGKLQAAEPKHVEAIKLHIDAIKLVIGKNIRGAAGVVGKEMLEGLEQIRGRLGG